MLKNVDRKLSIWDRDFKSGKLRKRLYKGVPDAVRGEVWSRLLHVNKTKEEQQGKYEVLDREKKQSDNSVQETRTREFSSTCGRFQQLLRLSMILKSDLFVPRHRK